MHKKYVLSEVKTPKYTVLIPHAYENNILRKHEK